MNHTRPKPLIAITMGCPVSVGPEIIVRLFQKSPLSPAFQPLIVGDLKILEKSCQKLSLSCPFVLYEPEESFDPEKIPVLQISSLPYSRLEWGNPTTETGKAMAEYIIRAVELAVQDKIDGIVTCPIAKKTLNSAGFDYPGHTEMLADLTGSKRYGMMMAGKSLRVTLATIHCSFSSILASLSVDKIIETISLTNQCLRRDFGVIEPKIGVAGINPHAGEHGIFGDEEERIISPAIMQAVQQGTGASGPYPPDTVFNKCVAGEFDAVVCMYHDQGLIPFKLLHFEDGVNITMGLPIVRTSVDHGTAYDIAGKGIASSLSLQAAVEMAATIANNRKEYDNGGRHEKA